MSLETDFEKPPRLGGPYLWGRPRAFMENFTLLEDIRQEARDLRARLVELGGHL
jgi:hypothetical protein